MPEYRFKDDDDEEEWERVLKELREVVARIGLEPLDFSGVPYTEETAETEVRALFAKLGIPWNEGA